MRQPKSRQDPDSVSAQIRKVIEVRGLTPYSVALAAGVAPSIMTRFFNDRRDLSGPTVDKVCAALGLKLTETRKGLGLKSK